LVPPRTSDLSSCRRPASAPPCIPPGLPTKQSGWSRKGGPARSGGPPFLHSPGGKPRKHPEAGRRPVALQGSTGRDQHLENNNRRARLDGPVGPTGQALVGRRSDRFPACTRNQESYDMGSCCSPRPS
jgi:hypothetical protein